MWIVKNPLRATLSFRGLGVAIPAGEQFDLDTLGRDAAEGSNQVQVAFEEGYLENVFKAPQAGNGGGEDRAAAARAFAAGISAEHFDTSLSAFKEEVLRELRAQLPSVVGERSQLEEVRAAISKDMQELVGELKLVRERFADAKDRVKEDRSLSDAEVRARLAFLEEQERELMRNFETLGKQVEQEGGDVMSMADRLADL